MLRVWGGGIYEPDAFYDACDEFGILIYHDLQFAVANVDLHEIVHELFNYSAAYQNFSDIVERETIYQAQRLSHHPALAIIDGCNECGGKTILTSLEQHTAEQLDSANPLKRLPRQFPDARREEFRCDDFACTSRRAWVGLATGPGRQLELPRPVYPNLCQGRYL